MKNIIKALLSFYEELDLYFGTKTKPEILV